MPLERTLVFWGYRVLCLATIRCVQSRTNLLKRKCACDYHMQREYRDILYLLFSFLFTLLKYIGFSGDTRLLPTISRLFADYSATALRLFRARAVPVRGRAARLDAKPGGRSVGGLRAVLARGQQAVPRTCRRGHERGAISKRRVQCLYLRRNYPLNARLCFKGIPIYPRHKRAVYVRFRGVFRGVQKTPRECACIRQGGRYSGGTLELQPLGDAWSWRQKKAPTSCSLPGC